MATLQPFRAFRYTAKAGDPQKLITQPYDKISPPMQAKYLAQSPYNLVRIILGERFPTDNDTDNVYTRAAKYFGDWIREGILAQDEAPGFYAYFQEFDVPDSGGRATRMGFIGLGQVEDYSAGIVYRHEQTLTGPKKDRRQVLDHTRAHFGQIFMLYPDREGLVDSLLSQSTQGPPLLDMADDYGARHRLWAITDLGLIAQIQQAMAPKKLLIADGHHRYETALGYRDDHPDDPSAQYVMMTFVNMYSPGLKVLATHRVLRNVAGFGVTLLGKAAAAGWKGSMLASLDELKSRLTASKSGTVQIGVVTRDHNLLFERPRKANRGASVPPCPQTTESLAPPLVASSLEDGEMDVTVLHQEILGGMLGIGEEAVREEKYIQYVRGMDAAAAEVREKGAQVAFLLEPTPIEDMARVAFGGGVMPQKSTDFYPKLLTGVAIYKL